MDAWLKDDSSSPSPRVTRLLPLNALHSRGHIDLDASLSRPSKLFKADYKQIMEEAQSSTPRGITSLL
ncbi:hypothetical protein E2562_034256 [Oryza meyeriana var. granulata]|uniref:Uncharacterized protein n=1 Tax=Oryza meyeriana var. granulata TaxID=110450 RepID=A0A6G1ESF3_9ORYZ|nr:hypothetical protein E2562_034256 [Oryza meyeriana var. granulata]